MITAAPRPILTTIDELYRVGPGPSSSHTMGPMLAAHDFRRRAARLPADVLRRATRIEVRLFGSLSATGRGHGTDRAVMAGLLGQTPATCAPAFLDDLAADPLRRHRLDLGPASLLIAADSIVFEDPTLPAPRPNTMVVRLLERDAVLYEMEYYSVGGGFVEWRGSGAPSKGRPAFPYRTMAELRAHVLRTGRPLPQLLLQNEMSIARRSEAEVWSLVDQVIGAMIAAVNQGLTCDPVPLPGPLHLTSKARTILERSFHDAGLGREPIGRLTSYAFAAAEENARGHVIAAAPTAGSAGVVSALAKWLLHDAQVPQQTVRDGLLCAAAIGYLCKRNATLSGAEGGCQAEIGVAAAMGAALCAHACGGSVRVVENAAESALEHHLGLTCDPVAGYVQLPCIERCAFGAVKAWTACCIASDEAETRQRVDLDTVIAAMAMTARDMSAKYKETSQAGLAAVVLC